jgi:hypothetical protein
MKKILIVFLSFVMMACCVACNNGTVADKVLPDYLMVYFTFDQIVKQATDVVKAKCVGSNQASDDIEYTFEVIERFSGEDVDEFKVKTMDYNASGSGTSFTVYQSDNYKIGKEYYLFLTRRVSVYYDYDLYLNFLAFVHVPADDVSKATIYNEHISKHSQLGEEFDAVTFEEYIKVLIESRTDEEINMYEGEKYILSNDMNAIIDGSPYVIEIQVNEFDRINEKTELSNCTITKVLKGDMEVGSTQRVIFPKGKVEPGKKYIIAATIIESPYVVFSSKNSLFDVSQYDAIMECINE